MNDYREYKFKVPYLFNDEEITLKLNSNVIVFIGANGLGKTQTMKALKKHLQTTSNNREKIRYLSSNRIGQMEQYRSKNNHYNYDPKSYAVGSNDDKKVRVEIETATGDFFTLDDKKDVYIKVSERLSAMFKKNILLKWDAGNLTVFFKNKVTGEEYSVVAEASGLVNIISILAALYDDETSFLLIDEPEVSLHPQLQSYLLREIISVSEKMNKTIVISTHSPEMIPFTSAESITNLVFFSEGNLPVQIDKDCEELQNKKLKSFITKMSQIYKTGFFAKNILLVEGASDLIICKYLAKKLNMNIDIEGSQIIPVDGKGQFEPILKLFRLIKKNVSILADLDGYVDNNELICLFNTLQEAKKEANQLGCDSISEISQRIKTDFCNLINKCDNDILNKYYKNHPYWKNKGDDKEKAKKRAIMALLFSQSDAQLSEWPSTSNWKSIKIRLTTLFESLEKLGCFILRKGAIESYYQYANSDTYEEKPSSAAYEVENLDNLENSKIIKDYSDIVRALKYINLSCIIEESAEIRKELAIELALIFEILEKAISENELYSEISRKNGGTASLFEYKIIEKNGIKGLHVDIKSKIINVKGFPFDIYINDNVNTFVKNNISEE